MRVIAGRHRGRRLLAPPGAATRPTADRVRQALFDMLWHAPWAGRAAVDGAPAPCALVFLDPPYGKGLVDASLRALSAAGWIAPGAVVCAEVEASPAPATPPPGFALLTERAHGPARLLFLRPTEAGA